MRSAELHNLRHLEAELTRVDLLLHRAVRRWRKAGQDPRDDFRGLYVSEAEVDALLQRSLSTGWGHTIDLAPGDENAYARALSRAQALIAESVGAAGQAGESLRLARLAEAFHLTRFEIDVLLICLAPALDLRYERLYGYLQDDVTRRRPGVNLALDLLCEPGPERLLTRQRFSPEAPLFKHHLLTYAPEPGQVRPAWLSQNLAVDDSLVAWLLGGYEPHPDLVSRATLSQPETNPADHLLSAALESLLPRLDGSSALLAFYGPDQAGQQAAARRLAAGAGRSLLMVDLAGLPAGRTSHLDVLRLALRDALLTRSLLVLQGWETLLNGGVLPAELTSELFAFSGLAIMFSRHRWQPSGLQRDRNLLWVEFPVPPYPQRRSLWEHFIQSTSETLDLAGLAGQFLLTTGQIRDAAATARDLAAQRGGFLENHDLFRAARIHSASGLSDQARKINPRYRWEDIILPPDQVSILHEIVATVRSRPKVLDEWGIGRQLASSNGVTMLFAGPPGTGKTMAAEVIAGELGLDLYKIDLSTIISKYIGETEKNLEKIFEAAESSNAILFFDEADAIFGKRSEVSDSHDRYANIEIAYLLQRMEGYDGVTILATNLRANLDEAFTRRLQFAVDFPFPEEADRLRIWRQLFPPDVPCQPDLDLGLLARRFKLAGGSIRNIIVSAAFLAAADGGVITMEHLLHGTRRELQKMGRLVRDGDLTLPAAADSEARW